MNNVSFLPSLQMAKPAVNAESHTYTPYEAHQSFASVLKDSINKVNEYQVQSDYATEKLVKGENIDLHQVMIASKKASITMQTTLEIRNKVIEAYQETMRMPV